MMEWAIRLLGVVLITIGTVGWVQVNRALRRSMERLLDAFRQPPQQEPVAVEAKPPAVSWEAHDAFSAAGPGALDAHDVSSRLAELDRLIRQERERAQWLRGQIKAVHRERIEATNRLARRLAEQEVALRDYVDGVTRDLRVHPWSVALVAVGTLLTLYPW